MEKKLLFFIISIILITSGILGINHGDVNKTIFFQFLAIPGVIGVSILYLNLSKKLLN